MGDTIQRQTTLFRENAGPVRTDGQSQGRQANAGEDRRTGAGHPQEDPRQDTNSRLSGPGRGAGFGGLGTPMGRTVCGNRPDSLWLVKRGHKWVVRRHDV